MEKHSERILPKLLELISDVSSVEYPELGRFPARAFSLEVLAFRIAVIAKTLVRLAPMEGPLICSDFIAAVKDKKMDDHFDPKHFFDRAPVGPAGAVSMALDQYGPHSQSSRSDIVDGQRAVEIFGSRFDSASLYAMQGPDSNKAKVMLFEYGRIEYQRISDAVTRIWDEYLVSGGM